MFHEPACVDIAALQSFAILPRRDRVALHGQPAAPEHWTFAGIPRLGRQHTRRIAAWTTSTTHGTKPAAHQGDVPKPGTDTQNVFLGRVASGWANA